MKWCTVEDDGKEKIIEQINTSKTLEGLKQVYLSYPFYQTELEDLFITRSKELKASQTIKLNQNGTDTGN